MGNAEYMGTLDYQSKTTTHIKPKKQNLPFKMYTFEPQNMFSIVNTMMNDPEFKKLAQNFTHTMEEMKKAKTNENQKASSENSSSPKTTEKSCSSPKTQNCSKTENSSVCPMFSSQCAIQGKTSKNRHQPLF